MSTHLFVLLGERTPLNPFLDQLLEQSRQDSLRYQELRRRLSGPVGLMGHMLQRPADPKQSGVGWAG
jgi:hypothetical protein